MQHVKRLTAVALVLPLILATPAAAQTAIVGPVDSGAAALGPSYVPSGGAPSGAALSNDLFSGPEYGVGVTNRPYIREDGSPDRRKGMIGSWPVANGVGIGVGLFSVSRYSRREADFKRAQPMKDVGQKQQRIAAVGLTLSF